MFRLAAQSTLAVALLAVAAGPAPGQDSEAWREMNRPVEPFRIAGPLYYVGASDVTAFLVTTPRGHVLIDGGFAETAPLIRDAIAALGFDVRDVRVLLNSHAHLDHAGGLAALRAWSGAEVVASRADAPLLERGGLGDDVLGDGAPFPAVPVDRRIDDGDTVELGDVVLTARVTPGHTRGCTSWDLTVPDGDRRLRVVAVCSLTILPGARLTGPEATYPGIAADFARSIDALAALPADVFLASHGSFFGLDAKRAALAADPSRNPFVDPGRYARYLARARERLDERLAAERDTPPPPADDPPGP